MPSMKRLTIIVFFSNRFDIDEQFDLVSMRFFFTFRFGAIIVLAQQHCFASVPQFHLHQLLPIPIQSPTFLPSLKVSGSLANLFVVQ